MSGEEVMGSERVWRGIRTAWGQEEREERERAGLCGTEGRADETRVSRAPAGRNVERRGRMRAKTNMRRNRREPAGETGHVV